MIRHESMCVGCPPELGCLGKGCPYNNVSVCYCDICEDNTADYHADGQDICEVCMDEHIKEEWKRNNAEEKLKALFPKFIDEEMLDEIFDDLSIKERCEVLDIDIRNVGD